MKKLQCCQQWRKLRENDMRIYYCDIMALTVAHHQTIYIQYANNLGSTAYISCNYSDGVDHVALPLASPAALWSAVSQGCGSGSGSWPKPDPYFGKVRIGIQF